MTVTKAVIPAAGLGTRFLPATKAQPKEMLPVVDKPTIQYVVEEAVGAGITDILIVTGRGKRSLEDHFDRSMELERMLEAKGNSEQAEAMRAISDMADIHYIRQKEPKGLGHAVLVAERHVGGEPFASDMPGREDEECFPPALRYKYDRRGHQTNKRAEPLAADFRERGEGKRLAFLKLVAGMLGVGLDELVRREQTRRHRNLAWLAAASLAGMAMTSTLAVAALQARDSARDQRREAEGAANGG